jgi:dienelactone hydrolase
VALAAGTLNGLACGSAKLSIYDPLLITHDGELMSIDLSAHDPARQREIPLRIYLPALREPAPVVLYSHGLGGSRATAAYLGEHWAGRGYVAVFLQHPGSDDAVWRDVAPTDVVSALSGAATAANHLARVQDVFAVLAQLETWNANDRHALSGRLDLNHVGMSGHSFGAMTTQAVSGQRFPAAPGVQPHPQIKAAIMFSPSTPVQGDPGTAFGSVAIPWLLMTGTRDAAAIGASVDERLKVYPALPDTIDKYELVLFDAEHYAFTERALTGIEISRDPNHHRAILALSTAFWDAYLRSDTAALQWLQGTGVRGVLEERDSWRLRTAK